MHNKIKKDGEIEMNEDSHRRITVDHPSSSSGSKSSNSDNFASPDSESSSSEDNNANIKPSSIELRDRIDSNEHRNAENSLDNMSQLRSDSRALFTDINFRPQANEDDSDQLQVFKRPSYPLIEQVVQKRKKGARSSRKWNWCNSFEFNLEQPDVFHLAEISFLFLDGRI